MRLFYTILWWNTDRDLTIAMNTGRNPRHIRQREDDVRRYRIACFKESLK